MALALFKEKRFTPRRQLSGLLPGKIVRSDMESEILCRPVDVSGHGVGLVSKEALDVGERVFIVTPDKTYEFEVMWTKPGFGKQDKKRIGLICVDKSLDVLELFERFGCFED